MAFGAHVQSVQVVNTSVANGGSASFASITVTATNTLLCAVRYGGGTTGTQHISDDKGNTWATDKTVDNSTTDRLVVHRCSSPAAGATVVSLTIDTGGPISVRAALAEYEGTCTLDQSPGAFDPVDELTLDSGSATTTVAAELLFGAGCIGGLGTFTAGASYTLRQQVPAAPSTKICIEDRVVSSTASYNATFTTTASAGTGSNCIMCSYYAATPNQNFLTLLGVASALPIGPLIWALEWLRQRKNKIWRFR